MTKTNHGAETPESERDEPHTPVTLNLVKKRVTIAPGRTKIAQYSNIVHEEATLYRSAHTMKCEVFDGGNNLVMKDTICVMIR